MVKVSGFLFPFGLLNNLQENVPHVSSTPVPGREEFYGDEIEYLQPIQELSFDFLCLPLTKDSPGVYDVDFCLPYFPDYEDDIMASFQREVTSTIITDRI